MTRAGLAVVAAVACLGALSLLAVSPSPASASLLGKACGLVGGIVGKACDVASSPGRVLGAGKSLITGHVGSAAKDLLGGGSAASRASTALALAALVTWAGSGARSAFDETAKVLSHTTRPNLRSTWFSGAYWRMAGIAALLTLPFLFAAAIQALMRSDMGMLAQAALGYLPLAMLAVGIAAPLAMLLLAATDQLCAVVSSQGAGGGVRFLTNAGRLFGIGHFVVQPFITFLLAVIAAGGALVLWLELAVREAAVYVIVLMLPLAFAAMVWPARRVWAVRSVELLVALILSKFAIVAVLGLAGAALGQATGGGLTTALAGTVLVILAAFSPWALLRLLPLSELAAGAAGSLSPELRRLLQHDARRDNDAGSSLSERPPDQRSNPLGPSGADSELERLRGHDNPAAGPRRSKTTTADGAPQPREATVAAERRGKSIDHDHERTAPTTADGRPGVLGPVEGAAEGPNGDVPRTPPLTLERESFGENGWIGPVNDLLSGEPGAHASGEPGEDHNPLPPPQEDDTL